jgi:hypothetical protein
MILLDDNSVFRNVFRDNILISNSFDGSSAFVYCLESNTILRSITGLFEVEKKG